MAAQLVSQGETQRAEALCGHIGVECAPVVHALGALAFSRADLKRAVPLLRTAYMLAPEVEEFGLSAARAALAGGDPSGAIEVGNSLLAQNPSSSNARRLVGEAYCQRSEYDLAEAALSRVTEDSPEDAQAWACSV